MFRKLYLIFGIFILATYSYAQVRGLEFQTAKKGRMSQQDLRQHNGGHRSFWYAGFHGGK
jgi:hypothetical protein